MMDEAGRAVAGVDVERGTRVAGLDVDAVEGGGIEGLVRAGELHLLRNAALIEVLGEQLAVADQRAVVAAARDVVCPDAEPLSGRERRHLDLAAEHVAAVESLDALAGDR